MNLLKYSQLHLCSIYFSNCLINYRRSAYIIHAFAES